MSEDFFALYDRTSSKPERQASYKDAPAAKQRQKKRVEIDDDGDDAPVRRTSKRREYSAADEERMQRSAATMAHEKFGQVKAVDSQGNALVYGRLSDKTKIRYDFDGDGDKDLISVGQLKKLGFTVYNEGGRVGLDERGREIDATAIQAPGGVYKTHTPVDRDYGGTEDRVKKAKLDAKYLGERLKNIDGWPETNESNRDNRVNSAIVAPPMFNGGSAAGKGGSKGNDGCGCGGGPGGAGR
jgi:hypothetical protein